MLLSFWIIELRESEFTFASTSHSHRQKKPASRPPSKGPKMYAHS
jgi:hypothetical protein